jgi:hypothetical protein
MKAALCMGYGCEAFVMSMGVTLGAFVMKMAFARRIRGNSKKSANSLRALKAQAFADFA